MSCSDVSDVITMQQSTSVSKMERGEVSKIQSPRQAKELVQCQASFHGTRASVGGLMISTKFSGTALPSTKQVP